MVKHHVVWARETGLWFLSSSGIKFMFANEAKLLNEVLPANPLLNQLLQFLSTRKRQTMTVQQLGKKRTQHSLQVGSADTTLITCLKS